MGTIGHLEITMPYFPIYFLQSYLMDALYFLQTNLNCHPFELRIYAYGYWIMSSGLDLFYEPNISYSKENFQYNCTFKSQVKLDKNQYNSYMKMFHISCIYINKIFHI